MRNLASIQEIRAIHPIDGKDRIVLAEVLGWTVIVQKSEYAVGDKCVYVEIDSVLPEKPEFEFLRPKKFRIKTMKMGGVLSQGICFPLSILPDGEYQVGDDVTQLLGVTKYDEYQDEPQAKQTESRNPLRAFLFRHRLTRPLARLIWQGTKRENHGFPEFVSKTDETRIQNMPHLLEDKKPVWIGREKIDGQSGTFFLKKTNGLFGPKYDFGVCSRNNRLMKPDNSSYWYVAQRYHIRYVLMELLKGPYAGHDWICIQGECIGPKVQGNKYHVSEPDLYCFNLILPTGKVPCAFAESLLGEYGIKWVPLVTAQYALPDTIPEILDYATGQSALYPTLREGIVFRDYKTGRSFKAVSPDFLLKHGL